MRLAAILLVPLAACAVNDRPARRTPRLRRPPDRLPDQRGQDGVETRSEPPSPIPTAGSRRSGESPKVRQWVAEQNSLTDSISPLAARGHFRRRMAELFSYERYTAPVKEGGRYFYTRNTGLQNQSVLYLRDGMAAPPRPADRSNSWSEDGATAAPRGLRRRTGDTSLYAVQEGRSDWRC